MTRLPYTGTPKTSSSKNPPGKTAAARRRPWTRSGPRREQIAIGDTLSPQRRGDPTSVNALVNGEGAPLAAHSRKAQGRD